jgi:DNA-binding NarL/FixJ family response regulator
MIYVMVCDDHQLVVDGIKLMLSNHDEIAVIASASNGQEAIDYIKDNKVDVLLLDINMPIKNGLETCKYLQSNHPDIKVIGLSMVSDVELIQSMIGYGARGYLLKNSGQDEVIETILDVNNGKQVFDPSILSDLLNRKVKKHETKPAFPKLSRREKEVLQLIVDEHTTSEIAESLFISFGTVESHRRNIISKLGVRNTAGLVRMAFELGLLED